jgi:Ca-activated chloride channel family protein
VTGFADWRDGVRVAAGVAGREAAARAFDAAVAEGRRAALGEAERDRFRMHLDAIPGRGARRIELTYVQSLDGLGGARSLVFPAEREAPPTVFDLEVELRPDAPDRSLTGLVAANHPDARTTGTRTRRLVALNRTGRGLERDFVLRWRQPGAPLDLSVRAARRGPGSGAYLEARFAFDADPFAGDRPPRDVLLLLDASLSMAGEPLARSRTLARRILEALGPEDRIALLVLREDVEAWIPDFVKATPAVVSDAVDAIEGLRAGGLTDLSAGLEAAAARLAGRPDALLVLSTDGQPTDAEAGDRFAVDVDAAAFAATRVILAHHVSTRRGLELATLFPQATLRFVPDGPAADETVEDLVRLVTAPVLEDLSVTIEGDRISDVEGVLPGRLAQGEAVRLLARTEGPAKVRVEGLLHGIPVALEAAVEPAPTASPVGELLGIEWARLRVAGLEASLARADAVEREMVGQEIRGLGLTYGIATRLTSFVTVPVADSLGPDRIKPGDPEIRVRADRSARDVLGVLPWGELVPCTWDETEGLWLGRFLVPRGVPEGLYKVRILVRTQAGFSSRGTLHFRVDAAPPVFELTLETADGLPVSGPAEVDLPLRFVARPADHVFDDDGVADPHGDAVVRDRLDLKRIVLQLGDQELPLHRTGAGERWEAPLPLDLPPGLHVARLVAVDYALNATRTEITFEVP